MLNRSNPPSRRAWRAARIGAAVFALAGLLGVGVFASDAHPATEAPSHRLSHHPTALPAADEVSPDHATQAGAVIDATELDSQPQLAGAHPRVIWMQVTAYCPCAKCCGKATGITASGKRVSYNRGQFVAADTTLLPFGTQVSIPGYHNGAPVPVIDRGGKVKGNHIDVYFPTHEQAVRWGNQRLAVTVLR